MTFNHFYHEILTEHNLRPQHRLTARPPSSLGWLTVHGVNPNCGDEFDFWLHQQDELIDDLGFMGSGCAISTASADLLADLLIGKKDFEARALIALFIKMIHGQATSKQLALLQEAQVLADVQNLPARAKCATLAWRSVEKILTDMI